MTTRQVAYRLKSDGKAELTRDLADVGRAGEASQKAVAGGVERTNQAMDRQMERWRKMAAAAREQQQADERQAAINRVLGVGGGSGKSAEESAAAFMGAANDPGRKGMSRNMRNTLIYTASDIIGSSANGIDPMRLGMQQGPQLLQAIALESENAASKALKLGLAFGGVAAAIGVTAAAAMGYEKAVNQMEVAAGGLGATAGLTGRQLDDLAATATKVGGVSTSAARDMAAAYVSTGRIGGDVMAGLISITRDYARMTGQDAKAATQELGKSFADPARGADDLNGKLNFLDDTTYRYIQTLVSQGKTQEAQAVMMDALGRKVLGAADNFDVLGGAVNRAKNFLVDMFNWYGRLANRMAGGGVSLQEQLAGLQRRRAQVANDPAVLDKERLAQLDREIAAVEDRIMAGWKAQGEARLNQMAADARAVVEKVNPRAGQLRDKEAQRATLLQGMSELDPAGQREARGALKTLDADIAAMKAGYASAADQAAKLKAHTRDAAEEARKAAAEAKRQADNLERLEDIRLQNIVAIAKIRGSSGSFEDKAAEAEAANQQRIQALTNQYQQAGIELAKARALAEHQVGLEIKAQSDALAEQLVVSAEHLTRLEDVLAKGPVVYDENEKALQSLKGVAEDAFDRITDPRNWDNWRDVARAAIQDIVAELIKLAAINPIKNALFGQNNPVAGGGFWDSVIKGMSGGSGGGVGHNAWGTENWRGGFTEVGEHGRETVWLPPGSKVFSSARSSQMGGTVVNINMDARGADASAARAVQIQVDRLRAELPALVVKHANDGISRRRIR